MHATASNTHVNMIKPCWYYIHTTTFPPWSHISIKCDRRSVGWKYMIDEISCRWTKCMGCLSIWSWLYLWSLCYLYIFGRWYTTTESWPRKLKEHISGIIPKTYYRRRRSYVTLSLIGRVHTQNDPIIWHQCHTTHKGRIGITINHAWNAFHGIP